MARPTFGQNLETFLKAAGVTQAELARRVRVEPSTVTRWKQDLQHPSFLDFLAILAVLKVDALLLAGSTFVEPEPAAEPPRRGRPPGAKAPATAAPKVSDFNAGMERGPTSRMRSIALPSAQPRRDISPKKQS